MTIETQLRKRAALYKGEVGFFPHSEIASDDISTIADQADCLCKISSPKNLALLAKLWCIADVVAKSHDHLYDKEDAMDYLKKKARFVKTKIDPTSGEVELVGKSLARCSNETLSRLANRMVHIVCTEIIPGMEPTALRQQLEDMVTK